MAPINHVALISPCHTSLINITVSIVYIIHRSIVYLKHNISETGFCLLLQVEHTQLGPVQRQTSSIYWAQLSRFHLKTETDVGCCEMLRIPHCLDSRLTDGDKVVSLTHRPRSIPQNIVSASGTHFC
jgi:hypothetical protein